MSRIFSISGNFMQNGRWSEPNPSFKGKIVVADDGGFRGYCDELYECDMSDINKTRFIVGVLATNRRRNAEGIMFYKLSNDPVQAPLLYIMQDLSDSNSGSWSAPGHIGLFVRQGEANITLEKEDYSEEEEDRIHAKFTELDKDLNGNGMVIAICQNLIGKM